jgi:hypothetical protein
MQDHRFEVLRLVEVLLHQLEGKLQFELLLQGVALLKTLKFELLLLGVERLKMLKFELLLQGVALLKTFKFELLLQGVALLSVEERLKVMES